MYKNLARVRTSRSKVKVTGDKKKRKTAESSPMTMHRRACAVARPYVATDDTIACRPGVTGYAGGKSAHVV